jgi:hypothetical protein
MGTFVANQVVVLIALLCVGEGVLLIGREIYWRLRALRVEGTVIGVREESPMMFYSVYRYISLSGEIIEATSSVASGSTRGRETGRTVKLLVFAERPDEVNEANSAISGIGGAVLLLGGSWPLYAALTQWPVNTFTWLVLAAGALYIAQRLRRHLIPNEQRQAPIEWRKERERHRAELAAMPVRRIEDILSAPQATERRAQRNSRVLAPILAIVGFGAIYLGAHMGRDIVARQAHGWNWLPAILLGVLGCYFLFMSVRRYRAARAAGEN